MNRRLISLSLLAVCWLSSCGRIGFVPIPAASDASSDAWVDAIAQDASHSGDAAQAMDSSAPLDGGAAPDASHIGDAAQATDSSAPLDGGTAQDAGQSLDAAQTLDAGTGPQDAEVEGDAGNAVSLPACGGVRVRDLCWYLGQSGESCQAVCSGLGGYDALMAGVVGTSAQGGSAAGCNEVLAAVGQPGPAGASTRSDGNGFGCHLYNGDAYWLKDMPNFSPTVSGVPVRIACACLQ